MMKATKLSVSDHKAKQEKFIDLASATADADKSGIIYVCPNCDDTDLILDATHQVKSPFSKGRGYFCGSCQKTFDDSLVHLHKKPKAVTSTIGDFSKGNNNSQVPILEYISEDRGIGPDIIEDEYQKYDPEESADEHLINQGATIIHSEIQLTDSSGRNRIIVRRKDSDY